MKLYAYSSRFWKSYKSVRCVLGKKIQRSVFPAFSACKALREKPYFPSPGIWKAQKDQTSSFHQLFGWKKDPISHCRKDQNKNFSVINKYHISIKFLAQKYHTRTFKLSVNMMFHPKEDIISSFFFVFCFFYVELKHPPPPFSGYPSFLNTRQDHLFTNLLRWKRFFWLPEIHNINFSFILKLINSSFLLNMNFPFVQSS